MTDARGLPDQRPSRVRLEWGPTGARALVGEGATATLVIVVDVLSFSTTVTVACEQGTVVHPYPHRDRAGAQRLARLVGATLARPRGDGRISLSPASLTHAAVDRLVLPSPNGATIAHTLLSAGAPVVAGCLRNASAVAAYALDHMARSERHDVVLVPAGERWPDTSLRPCVEDHLGAGAITSALLRSEPGLRATLSPEAQAAATLWDGTPDSARAIMASTSGRELIESGWSDDVLIAVQADVTRALPRLRDDGLGPAFRAW